ncbi:MAG TPA: hypothetical protein VIH71_16750 [Solirubrobacteraceae bacterium]
MPDDSLARAEIEVVALDRPMKLGGFAGGRTTVLAADHSMILPAAMTPAPTEPIFRPNRPGTPVRALVDVDNDVAPLAEGDIAALKPGEPITYAVIGAENLDLRHFRAVAAQAADLQRRLVIVTRDQPDE